MFVTRYAACSSDIGGTIGSLRHNRNGISPLEAAKSTTLAAAAERGGACSFEQEVIAASQSVKISYDQMKGLLYIHLSDRASVDSDEVQDGVVLDYDANGSLASIDL